MFVRHLWVPACLRALLKYIVFSTELWRLDETDSTSYQYVVYCCIMQRCFRMFSVRALASPSGLKEMPYICSCLANPFIVSPGQHGRQFHILSTKCKLPVHISYVVLPGCWSLTMCSLQIASTTGPPLAHGLNFLSDIATWVTVLDCNTSVHKHEAIGASIQRLLISKKTQFRMNCAKNSSRNLEGKPNSCIKIALSESQIIFWCLILFGEPWKCVHSIIGLTGTNIWDNGICVDMYGYVNSRNGLAWLPLHYHVTHLTKASTFFHQLFNFLCCHPRLFQ